MPRLTDTSGNVTQDGGKPILLDSSTKLTADQTLKLEVSAYDSSKAPTWCNLRYVDPSMKKIYSDIYMGKGDDRMSPARVDPVVYCTQKSPLTSLTTTDWKQFPAYQNLLFSEYNNPNLQFMADLSELSGQWTCAFTYEFGGTRYVCPTIRMDGNYTDYPLRNITFFTLKDGYYWGENFAE